MSDREKARALDTVRDTSDRGNDRAGKWVMVVILLAFVILAGSVSVWNPLFESTDEIRHYRYVRHLVTRHSLPVQGEEAVRSQSHHPPLYYVLSALVSAWVPSPHTPEFEQPMNPFWGYRNWEAGVDNKLQYLHGPAERFPFREGYLAAMVPRWVNVLLGALTVWLTYRLGLQVWQDWPPLAWGAAALVAFNPQFIYLSGTMNNDIIAAVTGTAVLSQSLNVAQKGPQRRQMVLLGLFFGLALLAKFHLLVMGGIIALALAWWFGTNARDPGLRKWSALGGQWLRAMALVLAVAALLSGWWFLRNWWLYGDPTGLNKVNELWAGRPAAGNWWALKQGVPYLWSSLWGRFGYGQIPLPSTVYQGIFVIILLALAGYLMPGRRRLPVSALVLLVVTVAVFVAVVTYYILIQPAGPMGRFLFPALPAFAVLVIGGLNRWPVLWGRPTVTASGVTVGMGSLALLALGGYLAPAVRYPATTSSPPPGQPIEARLGDVARILAVEVRPQAVHPGEPIFLTVAWEPLRQTADPYNVYVHLVDAEGVLIAQRDTWPGLGRAPTTVWEPGTNFVDTYRVDVPETAYAPNQAIVRVGLYEPTSGRLSVLGPGLEPLGDGVEAGTFAVDPLPGPWPNVQQSNFGDEVMLVGYTLEPRSLAAGETFTLTLFWQPTDPDYDYGVFAQVIDPAWNVWGSKDGAWLDWSSDQVIRDVRRITLLPGTPSGSYPVQVGLVHGETGRLPVIAPQGHHIDERVLLGPVRVTE
jgi:hypothetical protein